MATLPHKLSLVIIEEGSPVDPDKNKLLHLIFLTHAIVTWCEPLTNMQAITRDNLISTVNLLSATVETRHSGGTGQAQGLNSSSIGLPEINFSPNYNTKLILNEFSSNILGNKDIYCNKKTICLDKDCNHQNEKLLKCKDGCRYCENWLETIPLSNSKFAHYCCKNSSEVKFNCKSENIVYFIMCSCQKVYVGETKRPAHKRWYEHTNEIRKAMATNRNSNRKCKQLFYEHFNSQGCNPDDLKFGILKKVDSMDTKLRESEENFFIRLLNTTAPFGLNQKIKFFGNVSNNPNDLKLAFHPYFNLRAKRDQRSHGIRSHGNNRRRAKPKPNTNLITTFINLSNNEKRFFNYKLLNSRTIKALINKLGRNDEFKIFLECLAHEKETKQVLSKEIMFLQYEFSSKIMDKIGISQIVRSELRNQNIDLQDKKYPKVTVSFSYKPKISGLIHNQRKLIEELDANMIKDAFNNINCCSNIPKEHLKENHLATGNLSYLPNLIQNSLVFGNNYRCKLQLTNEDIKEDIEKYSLINRKRITKNFGVSPTVAETIINNTNNRIFEKYLKIQTNAGIEENLYSQNELKHLKRTSINLYKNQNTVICGVDKATNNSAVICRNLYIRKLCEDLGINTDANNQLILVGNETFKPTYESLDSIDRRLKALHRRFCGYELDNKFCKLPTYYLLPKFHKPGDKCKTRPISNCRDTYLAKSAEIAAKMLNHLRTHFINLTNLEKLNNGRLAIKSINSTDKLLEYLDNLEDTVTPHTIKTFDFKSVFTSFDFTSIRNAITYVANRCFNSDNGKYLTVGFKKCYYSNSDRNGSVKFNKNEFLEFIDSLLKESYVKIGNMIFNQIKGIPMGSKSSAILCDLSLISMEHQYLLKQCYMPITAVRYQDDILVFDLPNFIEIYGDIYSSELELEEDSNEDGKNVHYLDTTITIDNGRIMRTLFDKRDSFNFKINNLFHSKSNVRRNLINNVAYAQTLRICKINNSYSGFIMGLRRLKTQLLTNGFNDKVLIDAIWKVSKNRIELIHKFMSNCQNTKAFIKNTIHII